MKRNDSIPGKWCDDIASKIECFLANYTIVLHTNTVYQGGQRSYNLWKDWGHCFQRCSAAV